MKNARYENHRRLNREELQQIKCLKTVSRITTVGVGIGGVDVGLNQFHDIEF